MKKVESGRLKRLASMLEHQSQSQIMQEIAQFDEAEIYNFSDSSKQSCVLHPVVFNVERGMHLQALIDFLKNCPSIQPFDLILANELDVACHRSGLHDVPYEIAQALGMNYVFGLEFIELKDPAEGFHGNAIFSRWPIVWAKVLHLPEQYNWYFDRQQRIGGRCAVLAQLDIHGQPVGVASIHLENRTTGIGRQIQMKSILEEVSHVFNGIPVVLGGDLNTNTFDGRDTKYIRQLADNPDALPKQIRQIEQFEPLLADCSREGYEWRLDAKHYQPTRRKPLPQGGCLWLPLDWILSKGLFVKDRRIVSTLISDCGFAQPDSALAQLQKTELSDHNAVWASLGLQI
ncbi:MAG: hypothetical protein ACRC3H_03520 [Lachnospiraceae bacterium]